MINRVSLKQISNGTNGLLLAQVIMILLSDLQSTEWIQMGKL